MSVSKLESLPNEILIDTLEKYINGVDILAAFAHRLNTRFDALIGQCQKLRFNFIQCQRYKFRLCLQAFPSYYDTITELTLSDEDAPGQINDFLRLYPSFTHFQSLRILNFHYKHDTNDDKIILYAFQSLSSTHIETVSIKMNNNVKFISINEIISILMNISTLKHLCIVFANQHYLPWELPATTQSNLESLTITGMTWDWYILKTIFLYAPGLKYINILSDFSIYLSNEFLLMEENKLDFKLMPMLRTFIINLTGISSTSIDILTECFNAMPNLHRLEIYVDNNLTNADAWETILTSSLPNVSYFTLTITGSTSNNLSDFHFRNTLEHFQTSFWTEKRNFNVITISKDPLGLYRKHIDDARGNWYNQRDIYNNLSVRYSIIEYWAVPQRIGYDDSHKMDKIKIIRLSHRSSFVLQQYYFRNVKFLILDNLNTILFEWLTTNVDLTRITNLAILIPDEESKMIIPLMNSLTTINSLQINFKQLITYQSVFRQNNHHLKCLDLSDEQHPFKKEDIISIIQLFPNIEHLIINTADLYNIPLLHIYLPNLHSLTFRIVPHYLNRLEDFEQNQTENEIKFSFRLSSNWITIWIDETAFDESFWHTFRN